MRVAVDNADNGRVLSLMRTYCASAHSQRALCAASGEQAHKAKRPKGHIRHTRVGAPIGGTDRFVG